MRHPPQIRNRSSLNRLFRAKQRRARYIAVEVSENLCFCLFASLRINSALPLRTARKVLTGMPILIEGQLSTSSLLKYFIMQEIQKSVRGYSLRVVTRVLARLLDFFVGMAMVQYIDPRLYSANIYFAIMAVVSTHLLKTCFKKICENRLFHQLSSSDREFLYRLAFRYGLLSSLLVGLLFLIGFLIFPLDFPYFALSAGFNFTAVVLQALYQQRAFELTQKFQFQYLNRVQLYSLVFKTVVTQAMYHFTQLYKTPLLLAISLFTYQAALFYFVPALPKYRANPCSTAKLNLQIKKYFKLSLSKLVLSQVQRFYAITLDNNLGFYFLASNLAGMFPRFLFQPLDQILANLLPTLQPNVFSRVTSLVLQGLIYFTVSLSLFCAVFAHSALQLFYSANYVGAASYLTMHMVQLIASSALGVLDTALVASGAKIQVSSYFGFAVGGCSLAASFFMKDRLGPFASTVLLGSSVVLARVVFCAVNLRRQRPGILPLIKLTNITIYLLGAGVSYLIKDFLSKDIFALAAGGIIYLLCSYKVFPPLRREYLSLTQKQHVG